jgi:5'-3' exonuclease
MIAMLLKEIPVVSKKLSAPAEPPLLCFDGTQKSFRRQIDPNYKLNHDGGGGFIEEIGPIFHHIKAAFRGAGWNVLHDDRYESDDVLFFASRYYAKQGKTSVIFTRDKDVHQSVRKGVYLYDPQMNQLLDKSGVYAKFGVYPRQIPMMLALHGDKNDGIPGIPGVSLDRAVKIVHHYGDEETMMADPAIHRTVRKRLKINLKLTTVIPVKINFADLPTPKRNPEAVREALRQYGLSKSAEKLLSMNFLPPTKSLF